MGSRGIPASGQLKGQHTYTHTHPHHARTTHAFTHPSIPSVGMCVGVCMWVCMGVEGSWYLISYNQDPTTPTIPSLRIKDSLPLGPYHAFMAGVCVCMGVVSTRETGRNHAYTRLPTHKRFLTLDGLSKIN